MKRAERILLFTGYPGFIGQRLIPRLLELMPDFGLVCLVQERFLEQARRDADDMDRTHPDTSGRLELVVGDITRSDLGLAEQHARRLKDELVGAWHLAAVYDLAVRREVGLSVNVAGTRHVLRFLEQAPRFERLDYVSTAYVSGTHSGTFKETDLSVGQDFNNHYEETKYQAEIEVAASGLPAAVYRPGIVVGDSQSGETAKFDGPYFVMAAMERTPSPGVFFRVGSGRHRPNIVPVDFVIEALARLAASPRAVGNTYHLTDPDPPDVATLAGVMARALGRRFVFVTVPRRVAQLVLSWKPVERTLGLPPAVLPYFEHACLYDTTHAQRDLAPYGVTCPRLPDYVDQLVAFYRARRGDVRRTAMV